MLILLINSNINVYLSYGEIEYYRAFIYFCVSFISHIIFILELSDLDFVLDKLPINIILRISTFFI